MKDDIVIVSAARTAVGAFNGAFASLPAHDLGKGPTVNSVQPGSSVLVLVFDSDLDPGTVRGSVTITGHHVGLFGAGHNRAEVARASGLWRLAGHVHVPS